MDRNQVQPKVLLLYMPTPGQRMLPFPPLGIGVLAGYLRREGFSVYIDDLEMKTWEEDLVQAAFLKPFIRMLPLTHNNPKKIFFNIRRVTRYVCAGKTDRTLDSFNKKWEKMVAVDMAQITHVGFSVMAGAHLLPSVCFAYYLKREYNSTNIIGGSFVTEKAAALLHELPFVDYLIVGEGERPLAQLLSGITASSIPSLIYREKNGKACFTGRQYSYVDNAMPDFEGLPFDLYRKYHVVPLGYESSKGCRKKCNFCVTKNKQQYFKPVDVVTNELAALKRSYHTRYFMFVDNAVNINKQYSIDLARAIIQENIDIIWSAYYIPDDADPEYFALLYKAGCRQLRLGVETPSTGIQSKMNKNIAEPLLSSVIRNSYQAGIWNHLIFMVGYPGERREDFMNMCRFMVKNKKYYKSAVVSEFNLGIVDLYSSQESFGESLNIKGCRNHSLWGIPYRSLKRKWQDQKIEMLYLMLLCCGIRFRGNFSKRKDRFHQDHFLYRFFYLDSKGHRKPGFGKEKL